MKNAEKSWEKEKADLVKQKKHEQSLVSKLTNDRQCLETRWLIAISLHIIHDIIVPNLALEFYF